MAHNMAHNFLKNRYKMPLSKPHYLPNGKLYTGPTHKMGSKLMTGKTHSASSVILTHMKPK